jgi:hypothetical protein
MLQSQPLFADRQRPAIQWPANYGITHALSIETTCATPRQDTDRGMTLRTYSSTSYEEVEKAVDPAASVQEELLLFPAITAVDAAVIIIVGAS